MDGDLFVLGRVLDAVFADEQDAAARIFLIYAQISGGQRHAQSRSLGIPEFVVNQYGILDGRTRTLRVAVVITLTVDREQFFNRNVGALEQTDLLGLFVFDGSLAPERIQVIFAEVFLFKLGRRFGLRGSGNHIRSGDARMFGQAI